LFEIYFIGHEEAHMCKVQVAGEVAKHTSQYLLPLLDPNTVPERRRYVHIARKMFWINLQYLLLFK
jgi:hypothetical protein